MSATHHPKGRAPGAPQFPVPPTNGQTGVGKSVAAAAGKAMAGIAHYTAR